MDDYKRGLLDMLDALTVTEHNGVFALHSQDLDLRKSLSATIIAALKYRNELAERAKLDEAVKLLESNGYLVSPAHLITEYEKAAEYLRKGGYTVTAPDYPHAADYPPGHPLHNPYAAKWINTPPARGERIPGRRIADDESASVIRRAGTGHASLPD